MATKLTFETTTCSRCGGTGSYSYCEMWGSTCFGCKGKKLAYTKRGAKARATWDAHRAALLALPVEAVVVGSRVLLDGKFRTIEAVSAPSEGGSCTRDGVTIPVVYIGLTFTKVYADGKRVTHHHHVQTGTVVTRGNTPEEWTALVAFADTLPGALLDTQPSTAMAKADAASAKRAATKAAKVALAAQAVSA